MLFIRCYDIFIIIFSSKFLINVKAKIFFILLMIDDEGGREASVHILITELNHRYEILAQR